MGERVTPTTSTKTFTRRAISRNIQNDGSSEGRSHLNNTVAKRVPFGTIRHRRRGRNGCCRRRARVDLLTGQQQLSESKVERCKYDDGGRWTAMTTAHVDQGWAHDQTRRMPLFSSTPTDTHLHDQRGSCDGRFGRKPSYRGHERLWILNSPLNVV